MVQLLDSSEIYESFEIAESKVVERQNTVKSRKPKPAKRAPSVQSIRTVNAINDFKQSQRASRSEFLVSSLAAVIFGSATVAFGYFLLAGI